MLLLILCVCSLLVAYVIANIVSFILKERKNADSLPPLATPYYPLLGNALSYKSTPHLFMIQQTKKLGPVFRINLAGMATTVVTCSSTLRQFGQCPETTLSSKEAIKDFGFEYVLGALNVFHGTDFHKYIIKNHYFTNRQLNNKMVQYYSDFHDVIRAEFSLQKLDSKQGEVKDFLYFFRRIFIRINIKDFMGEIVLIRYNDEYNTDFIAEFLDYQLQMEDAIAIASVLPRFLALRCGLWRVENVRQKLAKRLGDIIDSIWKDVESGEILYVCICCNRFGGFPVFNSLCCSTWVIATLVVILIDHYVFSCRYPVCGLSRYMVTHTVY